MHFVCALYFTYIFEISKISKLNKSQVSSFMSGGFDLDKLSNVTSFAQENAAIAGESIKVIFFFRRDISEKLIFELPDGNKITGTVSFINLGINF